MNGIQLTDYNPAISIQRNLDGQITQGFVVADILAQNQALILQLYPGELKEYPAVGCGIEAMLLDNDPLYWRSVIKEQLAMDNQQVESVSITTSAINIKSKY